MAELKIEDGFHDELRAGWQRFVDMTAPFRPGLHAYCHRLTGNVWEAEDLVQDTLLRSFARLGSFHQEIANPRAYLLRVASNGWIDTIRRRTTERAAAVDEGPRSSPAPETVRDAGSTLLQRLAPRERAAVVLKDVFDMSLEETADVLSTTPGAVKAALHRGRGRLAEPEDGPSARRSPPSRGLVDAFVDAYRAEDLEALLALCLESASVENVGCGQEIGTTGQKPDFGFFHAVLEGHEEWPPEMQHEGVRIVQGEFEDEPLVGFLTTRGGVEALEQIFCFEEREGRIARLHSYAFCPQTIRLVGEAMGFEVRTGLYRFPTPAPGEFY